MFSAVIGFAIFFAAVLCTCSIVGVHKSPYEQNENDREQEIYLKELRQKGRKS